MKKIKYEVYQKHETLLKIIYHIGGGIMFVSHVSCFMGYNHKTQLWRELNELIEESLVEKIKYHKHCVIKIKAFVIKMILDKEKVDSIVVTQGRIVKSAMICSIILKSYQPLCSNPEEYLRMVRKYSNFYHPGDYNLYLYNQLREIFYNQGMDTKNLENEILKISNTVPTKRNTLINFKSQNIYIEKYGVRKSRNEFIIGLALLDLTTEFAPSRISKCLKEFIEHSNSIFMNNLNITARKRIRYMFSIYTHDPLRLEYIKRQMKKVESYLQCQGVNLTNLSFNIINLNLTSALFSNQKIII